METQNDAMERAITQAIQLLDRLPGAEPDPEEWPEKLAVIRRVLRGGLVVVEAAREEASTAGQENDGPASMTPQSC